MEDVDKLMAAFGLKTINCVVGAVSSFVTLRFYDGLSTSAKWSTFVGGWALAAWGASPLRDFMEAPPKIEILYVLLLGLFGMAVTAEIFKLIKEGALGAILARIASRKEGK